MPLRFSLALVSISLKISKFSSLMQSSYLHFIGIIATDSFQVVYFMASTKALVTHTHTHTHTHIHTHSFGEGL